MGDYTLTPPSIPRYGAQKGCMSEHNYERNADAEIERLRGIIDEVHSWAVCGCIATPQDMAQGLPRIVEITTPDWHDELPNKQRGYVDGLLLVIFVVALAITAAGFALIVAGREDDRRWESFKAEHNCEAVGYLAGQPAVMTGFDANGRLTVILGREPGKTGWLCDDGMTYYR